MESKNTELQNLISAFDRVSAAALAPEALALLREHRYDRVRALYESGETVDNIYSATGVNGSVLYRILRTGRVPGRRKKQSI
jgi:hypothetical protein